MQFKDFVWPHNPRVYSIDYQRTLSVHKLPFGRYHLQNLGLTRRIMQGEGEFVGTSAYSDFKRLAGLFYDETPGILIHPVWQNTQAYLTELSLSQEPRADYVRYRFVFWECPESAPPALSKIDGSDKGASTEGQGADGALQNPRYHIVRAGDTLWKIALDNGLTLTALLQNNPQIKNPNLIRPGEQVKLE